MKRLPFYAILLAIYPVIDLYSLLPGGVPGYTVIRPIMIQVLIATVLFALFYYKRRDLQRAGVLTGVAVFYFSSTGYFYRSLPFQSLPGILHLVLVVFGVLILAILTHPLVWEKYLTSPRLFVLTEYLNIISIVVLMFPVYRIAKVLFASSDDAKVPWSQVISQSQEKQTLKTSDTPDIYYIILDGYGRQDALEDVFGYDNSEFIGELERMGFYVAKDSRSNYIRTVVSLSSSLNLDYINFAEEAAGEFSVNYLPLMELIQNNKARSLLERADYSTVAVSSDYAFTDWKNADVYLYPFKRDLTEIERFFYSSSALGAFYDPEFPFTKVLRSELPLPSYGTRREKILFAFDQLKEIPEITGPKFVFVHIIAPHPPFVFDAEGDPVGINRPYAPGDGEGFTGSFDEYRSLYIEQMRFVNSQIIDSIQAILNNSPQPPVIILQGDHGSGSLLNNSSIGESCMFERTSILNAYYMPDGKTEFLYPEITPVNSFRVIFNTYFGTNFQLLADKTYYSPFVNPYDFIDITERIEDKCQRP